MTVKETAKKLGVGQTTVHLMNRIVRTLQGLVERGTMTDDEAKALITLTTEPDKKKCVTRGQASALSQMPDEAIKKTVAAVMADKARAKEIINGALGDRARVGASIKLSMGANEFFTAEAQKAGMSRSDYISELLEFMAEELKTSRARGIKEGL